jgi:hypothetical protein
MVVNPDGDSAFASASMTPTVQPTALTDPVGIMDFFSAMHLIQQGYKVARAEWGNTDYCTLHDGKLHIYRETDGKLHPWLVSDGDMAGLDWETV